MVADAIAAENVRRLLDGTIQGVPEPETLAWHVYHAILLGGFWSWRVR